MYQGNYSGIQLYECSQLGASITITQCKNNKKNAEERTQFNEFNTLECCLSCEGLDGEQPIIEQHDRLRKCQSCRCWRDIDDFSRNRRTGERKVSCSRCEDSHKKSRDRKKIGK